MIELIFVIVILGILASVAIPRLAATRTDAEVATAVANLRTIVSEVSSQYVAHGTFASKTWKDFTNVPLEGATTAAAAAADATATAHLKVGNANCIGLKLVEKAGKAPAYIQFTKDTVTTGDVCSQVQAADPIKAIIESSFSHPDTAGTGTTTVSNAIAIGSNTSVYSK